MLTLFFKSPAEANLRANFFPYFCSSCETSDSKSLHIQIWSHLPSASSRHSVHRHPLWSSHSRYLTVYSHGFSEVLSFFSVLPRVILNQSSKPDLTMSRTLQIRQQTVSVHHWEKACAIETGFCRKPRLQPSSGWGNLPDCSQRGKELTSQAWTWGPQPPPEKENIY